jgi:hypothetical protein
VVRFGYIVHEMPNIINIFHKDILPVDLPAEYEMTGLGYETSEILFYRRGLSPTVTRVSQGLKINIPLTPIAGSFSNSSYKTNSNLKAEVKKFIIDSIPFLRKQEMRISEATKLAEKIFTDKGTFLLHALYSSDLENRIGPLYDFVSESKCFDLGRQVKNTLIFLPEETFTGIMTIKDQAVDGFRSLSGYTNSQGRFGIMLSKDNALMCSAI